VGYYKKGMGKRSVTWEDTVDEALCYGWIDGSRKSRDDESYAIRFTPRKPKSVWSQRNIDLVERLTAEGRMKPKGLAAFAHNGVHPDSGHRVPALTAELTPEMIERFRATPDAWTFYQEHPSWYGASALLRSRAELRTKIARAETELFLKSSGEVGRVAVAHTVGNFRNRQLGVDDEPTGRFQFVSKQQSVRTRPEHRSEPLLQGKFVCTDASCQFRQGGWIGKAVKQDVARRVHPIEVSCRQVAPVGGRVAVRKGSLALGLIGARQQLENL
jgi:hypothetical protein